MKSRYARFGPRPAGYLAGMIDPRLDDHLVGLEQELVELVERKHRAVVQGRHGDAGALQEEIEAVQAELVASAEAAATGGDEPPARVTVKSEVDPAQATAAPPAGRRRHWGRPRRSVLGNA